MENTRSDKEDILSYIVKMHKRGDRYADILRYLQRKNVDADTRGEMLAKLDALTKPLKHGDKENVPKYRARYRRIIARILFCALLLYLIHLCVSSYSLSLGMMLAIAVVFEVIVKKLLK